MRLLFAGFGLALGFVLLSGSALAQPSVPATFYGSVTVDGNPAADGVDVRAIVNGADCTQAAPGARPVLREGETALYVLSVVHESQRPGCARDGSNVTFTIGGRPAVQAAAWKPGPIHLDLSVGAAPPIPLPSPTGTIGAILATETAAATPQATGTLARPTGTPPTDDVTFERGTPKPPGATPVQSPALDPKENGGSPVVGVVLVVLVALTAAGVGAGFALSRRHRPPRA